MRSKSYKYLLASLLLGTSLCVHAQSVRVPTDYRYRNLAERYETMQGELSPYMHTNVKPFSRQAIAMMVDSFPTQRYALSTRDYFNFQYLQADNPEWTLGRASVTERPLFRALYTNRNAFYSYRSPNFEVYVNPVLNVNAEIEKVSGKDQAMGWHNTRGGELRGLIAKKVGFYTYVGENQSRVPQFVNDMVKQTSQLPGVGLTKRFDKYNNAYDYFEARGYVSFKAASFIEFQFGHDRNFIGDGYRSLLLSDYSKDYVQLRTNVKVWKINYTIINAQLTPFNTARSDLNHRQKFMALHYLSMNLSRKVQLGLFENIIFARGDSAYNNGYYDLNYMNPIIFYRAIEHSISNSSDNAIAGLTFKYIPVRNLKIYGQLLLDEFNVNQLRDNPGANVNKYGWQLGAVYTNAFTASNLDLQVEVNRVRPYTYQHSKEETNYSNAMYALAHPLGANFTEIIGTAHYQPLNRLSIYGKIITATYGTDTGSVNFGKDIFKNYQNPYSRTNNTVGQGISNTLLSGELLLSYMIYHNIFVDARVLYRQVTSELPQNETKGMYLLFGVRMNSAFRFFDF